MRFLLIHKKIAQFFSLPNNRVKYFFKTIKYLELFQKY
jgi:hypothetical protein